MFSTKFELFVVLVICSITFSEAKQKLLNNKYSSSRLSQSKQGTDRTEINLSAPGTKWCGPGNTASNYNDLGSHADVDMCCRDHDHCDNIPAGQTKYNLTNDDFFTVLHCNCDKKFYKCLYEINSKMSNRIGKLYFTLRNRCYRNDYPIVDCAEYDTALFVRRCIHYVTNDKEPQCYQWFDLPLYYPKTQNDEEFLFENA